MKKTKLPTSGGALTQEMQRCISSPLYFIEHYLHSPDNVQYKLTDTKSQLIESIVSGNAIGISYTDEMDEAALAYIIWYAAFNQSKNILVRTMYNDRAIYLSNRLAELYESISLNLPKIIHKSRWSVEFESGNMIHTSRLTEHSERGYRCDLIFYSCLDRINPTLLDEVIRNTIYIHGTHGAKIAITSSTDIPELPNSFNRVY